MTVLSIDASTTCIGWSVFEDDTLIKCGKIKKLWLRVSNDCMRNEHQLYYSLDGKRFTAVESPFPMRWGYWKGIRVGVYCYGESGKAEFDFFNQTF